MQLSTRHLLGIKNLTKEDISLILSTAEQFKEVLQRPVKKVPSLRDVTIVNLFYENSTRTRFSFELGKTLRIIFKNIKDLFTEIFMSSQNLQYIPQTWVINKFTTFNNELVLGHIFLFSTVFTLFQVNFFIEIN